MLGDPEEVHFQLWFIPEHGIEQSPSIVATAVGWRAIAEEARKFFEEDFKEPDDYGSMYVSARSALRRWEQDPDKWVVAMPVHYGTLVIA